MFFIVNKFILKQKPFNICQKSSLKTVVAINIHTTLVASKLFDFCKDKSSNLNQCPKKYQQFCPLHQLLFIFLYSIFFKKFIIKDGFPLGNPI